MPSINKILSSCKKINKASDIYHDSEILLNYLKLAIKKTFLSRKKQHNVSGQYKLLGRNVNYLSFKTLFILYNEIFIGLEYYFKSQNKKPFIIDCGSNMGMSILFYKYIYPDAEIIGFEPDIHAYNVLSKNVLDNKLSNTTVHQKALADKAGVINFFYDSDNISALHMSIMEERESKSTIEVECTTLSQYINKTVDFLKLDIEGAETLVMRDLNNNDKLKFIENMVIEYHHHIVKNEDNLSETLSILEENGFGYQITTNLETLHSQSVMQDIMIHAYKK